MKIADLKPLKSLDINNTYKFLGVSLRNQTGAQAGTGGRSKDVFIETGPARCQTIRRLWRPMSMHYWYLHT